MARPSNKDQRKEEILQAYEVCISLYGVEGATLKKVAEHANIARPLLRHHVGNSEDLLEQALERFLKRNDLVLDEFFSHISEQGSGKVLLETLFFADHSNQQTTDILIAWAFMLGAQTNALLKEKMNSWNNNFRSRMIILMNELYPSADERLVEVVSDGILGLYYNVESTIPIFDIQNFRSNTFNAAKLLLDTLEVSNG
jgi:AcrR family transcriptional regulator